MAASPAAARLTEAHRLAQARLAAVVVRQMLALWPLLDPERLDATVARWLSMTVPVVRRQRIVSARLTGQYLQAFRAVELGTVERFTPSVADDVAVEAVTASLVVTGPASIKSAMRRGVRLEQAVEAARVRVAGAAMRHTLAGGRDTLTATARSDTRALGWARATSARPCPFCAMLASRGAVYGSESVHFAAHDHCSCSGEIRYRDDADLPSGSDRWRDLWRQANNAGGDPMDEFRRLVTSVEDRPTPVG